MVLKCVLIQWKVSMGRYWGFGDWRILMVSRILGARVIDRYMSMFEDMFVLGWDGYLCGDVSCIMCRRFLDISLLHGYTQSWFNIADSSKF